MVRVLIMIALLLAAPLQGLSTGGVDLFGGGQAGAAQAISPSETHPPIAEVATKECCHEQKLNDRSSSACASDCKAVMRYSGLSPKTATHDTGGGPESANSSVVRYVDLRPPIS